MKMYNITKFDVKSDKEIKYGIYGEDDVKLITRGYRQEKDIPSMYTRKGSRYFFIVDIVKEAI
jgi:hypothetical protein